MVCLVNLCHLDPVTNGGVARTAWQVGRILAQHAASGQLELVFLVNGRFASQFPGWLGFPEVWVMPCLPTTEVTPLVRSLKPDMVVSPLFGGDPFDEPAVLGDIPHVVSMPDALALDHPEHFSEAEARRRRKVYVGLQQATLVVTASAHARSRLIYHLNLAPERVVVILKGADLDTEAGDSLPSSLEQGAYVFYPAHHWPHKRHGLLGDIMVEIWKRRSGLRLILTGGDHGAFVKELAARHPEGVPDCVVDAGLVSDAGMVHLYQKAEALLFASEYEGFGMPLIEAMHVGCPVICAPHASIPEVAGDAALYVAEDTAQAWAHAFLHALPGVRDSLCERGRRQAGKYTWQAMQESWARHLLAAGLQLQSPSHKAPGVERTVALRAVLSELLKWAEAVRFFETVATEREAALKQEDVAHQDTRARHQESMQEHRETVSRLKERIQKLEKRLAQSSPARRGGVLTRLRQSFRKRWQSGGQWLGKKDAVNADAES
ncbi:MAG: glycosyltransferase [Verrucomicrobium sp.]|nr:glycosyltransferase [Verrucomicrobium sp.]